MKKAKKEIQMKWMSVIMSLTKLKSFLGIIDMQNEWYISVSNFYNIRSLYKV